MGSIGTGIVFFLPNEIASVVVLKSGNKKNQIRKKKETRRLKSIFWFWVWKKKKRNWEKIKTHFCFYLGNINYVYFYYQTY